MEQSASYNAYMISIHALLAESDTWQRGSRVTYVISIHALLAESDCLPRDADGAYLVISIHALLAESDFGKITSVSSGLNFYPRSPCGERLAVSAVLQLIPLISIHALLAESD